MTRKAGGKDFVERRDFPESIGVLIQKLDDLKKNKRTA